MTRLRSILAIAFIFTYQICGAQNYEQEFEQRKTLLTDQLSQVFFQMNNLVDPEKHHWPKAIARLSKYGNSDSAANYRIARFRSRDPFHFTLVGMARIMGQYGQADSLVKYRKQYLQKVWNRSDTYNAFTGEGTENHINMSRTSGYLFAQYSLNYPTDFPQATVRLADMKSWVMSYSKRIYQVGNGEWNSSVYEAYNLIGWLNLFDLAADQEVKNAARAVLDYYVAEMALHHTQGVTGGAEMRGPAIRSNALATDYLSWLWFGDSPKNTASGFFNGKEYSQAIHAAVSTYRPNPLAIALGKKQFATPAYYTESRADYMLATPSYIKQNFYIHANYTLGAAYIPYGGWTNGGFQILNWKMVGRVGATSNTDAQVVVGSGKFWNKQNGAWRSPFDQFIQHRNVIIQLTKTPRDTGAYFAQITPLVNQWKANWLRDFNLRFPFPNNGKDGGNPVSAPNNSNQPNVSYIAFPQNLPRVNANGIAFYEMANTYMAIRSLYQPTPSTESNEATNRRQVQDIAPMDSICGFVIEFAGKSDYATLVLFQAAITANTSLQKQALQQTGALTYTNLTGEPIQAQYSASGTFTEPMFDWGYGITQPSANQHSLNWQQPTWPSGPGHGKVASWSVNSQNFPLSGVQPIFDGPNLTLQNSVLQFKNGTEIYEVDYTGQQPVFSIISALAKKEKTDWVNIYPNPAGREIYVVWKPQVGNITQAEILTYESKQLMTQAIQQKNFCHFSTSVLAPGLYTIRLSGYNTKIIKQFIKQ